MNNPWKSYVFVGELKYYIQSLIRCSVAPLRVIVCLFRCLLIYLCMLYPIFFFFIEMLSKLLSLLFFTEITRGCAKSSPSDEVFCDYKFISWFFLSKSSVIIVIFSSFFGVFVSMLTSIESVDKLFDFEFSNDKLDLS